MDETVPPAVTRLPTPAHHNLSRERTSFVGRRQELSEVSELVAAARVVTVAGPGGIGKTRLALRVAAGSVDSFEFRSIWLVDLATIPSSDDPGVVWEEVAKTLGVRPPPGGTVADAVAAHIAGGRTMVVLDNCEHLLAAVAAVVGEMVGRCPDLSVLATSREPLGVAGEAVYRLGPLPVPESGQPRTESDAVALFEARAREVRPQLSLTPEAAEQVGEICRRLDGIPLAIELAAALVPVLAVEEIAEHLDERFSLLEARGRLVPQRHQTLQSALDWSYDLLSPAEKALLRRLAVFAGGATVAEARGICVGAGVASEDVAGLLASLASKSLAVPEGEGARVRYRLLETVSAYARQRLEEAGEADTTALRHAEWFVAFAEKAWMARSGGDDDAGVGALAAEYANLRAALGWLVEHSRAALALRLAGALGPFWWDQGHLSEGRRWLERVLELSQTAPGAFAALRSRAQWGVGVLAIMQGDLDRATAALEESLAQARLAGQRRGIAQALNLLGFVSVFRSDLATAMPLLEESVALARVDGEPSLLSAVLGVYGRALLFSGDIEGAAGVIEETRRVLGTDHDDPHTLVGLGWVALVRGRHGEARRHLDDALRATGGAGGGSPFDTALLWGFLGELSWRGGDSPKARALLEEAVAVARSIGAPYPHVNALLGLGRVVASDGDIASALELLDEAAATARRSCPPYLLVRCLLARAELRLRTAGTGGARADIDEALAVATTNGDRAGQGLAQRCLAVIARHDGDYLEAAARYGEALDLHHHAGDEGGMAADLDGLAGVAVARGLASHAARLFGAAAAVRKRFGVLDSPLHAAERDADVAAARAALPPGEYDRAEAEGASMPLDEALRLAKRTRGGRRRATSGWAALSAAEREVVEMIGAGLGNAEIAERQYVSLRTVEGRVSRALAKLGLSSRRELREAARRRD